MYYQEFLPIKSLQNYIRYFWVLEDFTNDLTNKLFKIIPDGLPALIFQEQLNFFFDKKGQALPQLFIYGQSTNFTEHNVTGNFRIFGVYLQPTALKTIFNIDAFEFNHQNIPLESVISDLTLEQLTHAISIEEKIKIISNFILKQIQKVKTNDKKAEYISMLLQNGKSLKEVQLEMNFSERTLERLTKQYVGISPKVFSRIIRFQSGLNSLRETDLKKLIELAYENEYFDQSHYIREFKEFTGTTPKNFILHANEKLVNFPQWNI